MEIEPIVRIYSPWIMGAKSRRKWESTIPKFHRPVFNQLVEDLKSINQIISITGPRRVGKSTLLQQLVQHLLKTESVEPSRVLYYSFDDPTLFRKGVSGGDFLESLMEHMAELGHPVYLFLDEIQTLDRWELYLKKYYDTHYPVRLVVSGSASSPIFKKSRESLLGRVKDYHVLPFSFREFLLHALTEKNFTDLVQEVDRMNEAGKNLKGMFARSPEHLKTDEVEVPRVSDALWTEAQSAFDRYVVDGGFPEVWTLPTEEKKIEYLFDNQVKKVIYEDLVLATEFRKPEQLKAFYISLLERPGQEVNITSLSNDIGIGTQQIEKYLPLLEMTDLLAHASKFRKSPVRVRQGSRKYYLVDLALRNAVLRIGSNILNDPDMLGLYAENLVFNALKHWSGVLQIDYFRDGQTEVDFVVHLGPSRYWPIEVKYRNQFSESELKGLMSFSDKFDGYAPFVVSKNREPFGHNSKYFRIPLLEFLLLLD